MNLRSRLAAVLGLVLCVCGGLGGGALAAGRDVLSSPLTESARHESPATFPVRHAAIAAAWCGALPPGSPGSPGQGRSDLRHAHDDVNNHAQNGASSTPDRDLLSGEGVGRPDVGTPGFHAMAEEPGNAVAPEVNPLSSKEGKAMRMNVRANGNVVVFELNDSPAAKDLHAQLPLSIGVENYSSNEKIFYPPRKLDTSNTPLVKAAHPGTLAYYAPWADVVMFYGNFGSAAGLYELGHAVQGAEHIRALEGTLHMEAD